MTKIASHRISDVENMIREQERKRLHTSSDNTHSALVYICLILIGLYILYKLYNWFSSKFASVKAITDTNRSGNSKCCYIPATRVWPWHKRMCHLLTYSTVHSPSWKANRFAASQEIPRISQNPKVHYRIHKRPPPASILGQPNPVHIPTSHLLEIHPNITHPSTPRSPQWSLSLRFPQQDPIHPQLLTHMRHMHNPSHSSPFYHPHNIRSAVCEINSQTREGPIDCTPQNLVFKTK